MGKKFAQQQRERERAFFNAGVEMGRQQILDMMCIVLNDPKTMNKDTFGRDRLKKVIDEIGKQIDKYEHAWQKKDDADAMQVGLDNALAEAFGEEKLKDSFFKRYQYSPEFDYERNRWKG